MYGIFWITILAMCISYINTKTKLEMTTIMHTKQTHLKLVKANNMTKNTFAAFVLKCISLHFWQIFGEKKLYVFNETNIQFLCLILVSTCLVPGFFCCFCPFSLIFLYFFYSFLLICIRLLKPFTDKCILYFPTMLKRKVFLEYLP